MHANWHYDSKGSHEQSKQPAMLCASSEAASHDRLDLGLLTLVVPSECAEHSTPASRQLNIFVLGANPVVQPHPDGNTSAVHNHKHLLGRLAVDLKHGISRLAQTGSNDVLGLVGDWQEC